MCCAFLLLEMGPSCVASSDIGRGRPGGVRNANRNHAHAEAAPLRALPRPPPGAPRARTKWPENATVRPQPPSAQMDELSTPTRSHGGCLRAPKPRRTGGQSGGRIRAPTNTFSVTAVGLIAAEGWSDGPHSPMRSNTDIESRGSMYIAASCTPATHSVPAGEPCARAESSLAPR
jgi:hypothetical protein